MSKLSRIVIGLAAMSLPLAACSNTTKNESPPAAEVQDAGVSTEGTDPTSTGKTGEADKIGAGGADAVTDAGADTAGETVQGDGNAAASADADADAVQPTDGEPIASIPEKDIFLYPDKPEGVLLQAGEHKQHFDWSYDTPRMIMPQLQLSDYDGDADNELAAITYVGSGTGVSVYELHMLEQIKDNNGGHREYTDQVFAKEDYLAQLDQALTFKKVTKDGEWFGQVTVGGQQVEVGIQDFQKEYGEEAIEDRLGFGSIIQYEAENGALTFSAAVGLVIDNVAEPQYIGNVDAAVTYKSGKFKLEQFRFIPYV